MTDPIRQYIGVHIPENHPEGDGCWDAAERAMEGLPKPVGPTCVLCSWSQDIGHEAHALLIHPDDNLVVIEQMGQKFIVRLSS